MKIKQLALAILVAASGASTYADENGESVIYLGTGPAKSGDPTTTSNKKPITLGFLSISTAHDTVWGLDFGREGTKLDSTWGQDNAVKQASSYNFLIGRNIGRSENSRFDAVLILGMREKTASCPSSYLGYQCYADSSPDVTHGFNYGAVLSLTYRSILLGLRVTGESKQALVGYRF